MIEMDFMKKVEKISKKVGETASETYNAVVNKSGKVIEGTKTKFEITEKENKIQEIFLGMGRTVYEMYKKGENVGETFEQESEKVDHLNQEIDEMEKKILANKGLKECCQCDKVISKESHFCPKCGAEQMDVDVTTDESVSKQKVCPKCNAICQEDSEYCENCGEKIS